MKALPWWPQLEASCSGRVALVDGDAMFNRPGPRLVDAYEWLVSTLQATPTPPTPTPTLMPLPLHLSAPRSSPPPHPRPCDGCRRCRTPHRPTSQSSGSLSARGRRRRRAHSTESSGFAPSWRRRRRSWRRRSRAWWLPSRRCTCARCGRASTRTRTPRPATTRVDMCAECHVRRGPVRPDGARCGSQTPPGSLLQAL